MCPLQPFPPVQKEPPAEPLVRSRRLVQHPPQLARWVQSAVRDVAGKAEYPALVAVPGAVDKLPAYPVERRVAPEGDQAAALPLPEAMSGLPEGVLIDLLVVFAVHREPYQLHHQEMLQRQMARLR